MTDRKRIIIDLDGVVADTLPLWLIEWNNAHNDNLTPEVITAYEFGTFVAPMEKEFFALLNNKEIFRRALPMPGAVAALCALDIRFDVVIATYVIGGNGHEQKLAWLAKWCPFINPRQVIFCSPEEKVNISADYIVEDHPGTLAKWAERYVMDSDTGAFLVHQPYNTDLYCDWKNNGMMRVSGLSDVVKELVK